MFMRASKILAMGLVALTQLSAAPNATAFPSQDDLGNRAAALLEARCSTCHGSDSEKPRAVRAWADATDLAATTADPDLIVPGDPDDSTVYIVVADGDMPPPGSGIDPLTEEETELLGEWITAGATFTPVASVDDVEGSGAADDGAASAEADWLDAPLPRWLGHFHPLIIHFPLALFSVALLAELLARVFRKDELGTTATFCFTIGALSAVPSAALGWMLAASTSHSGDALDLHRWFGVGTAAFSVICLIPMYKKPGMRLLILLVIAGLAGFTGHMGGSLSYGSDWLDWPKS